MRHTGPDGASASRFLDSVSLCSHPFLLCLIAEAVSCVCCSSKPAVNQINYHYMVSGLEIQIQCIFNKTVANWSNLESVRSNHVASHFREDFY